VSSSHVYAVPLTVIVVGLPKKQLNLDIEFHYKSDILSGDGDALRTLPFLCLVINIHTYGEVADVRVLPLKLRNLEIKVQGPMT